MGFGSCWTIAGAQLPRSQQARKPARGEHPPRAEQRRALAYHREEPGAEARGGTTPPRKERSERQLALASAPSPVSVYPPPSPVSDRLQLDSRVCWLALLYHVTFFCFDRPASSELIRLDRWQYCVSVGDMSCAA